VAPRYAGVAVHEWVGLVVLLWIAILGLTALLLLWLHGTIQREDIWSISIYAGSDPLHLRPHPSVGAGPVLSAADIHDVAARFVADPFMVRVGARWYLFFEVLESKSRLGVIGLASSDDGITWSYERIILREAFHLSYPYVFEWEGTFYMIPETGFASSVRLYRAAEFPHRWEFVGELLSGTYWDPSVIYWKGMWWLFALDDQSSLTLHYAPELRGPWTVHPHSPVIRNDRNVSRPGGRMIIYDGKVVRYAQDGEPTYGSSLRAFLLDELSVSDFKEREVADSPVLAASGRGWNASGMHHADVQELGDGTWIASVDGNRRRFIFNWRGGTRRILDLLKFN
jgi:hypothetical protein